MSDHGIEHEAPDSGNDEPSISEELILKKVEEVLSAREAERSANDDGPTSKVPIQVRRFQRWLADAFFWAFYIVRKEPLAVMIAVGTTALASSAAVNYFIDHEWLDAKDFPFVVQSQHEEAMCAIWTIRHDQCELLVGIGQQEGPCPGIPGDCASTSVSE